MHLIDALADVLGQAKAQAALRTARLDGAASGRATITLSGGTVADVPYLTSYSPVVGDTVLILQTSGGQLVIIGRAA